VKRPNSSGARIPSRTPAPGNPFPRDFGRSESPEQSVEKGFSTQALGHGFTRPPPALVRESLLAPPPWGIRSPETSGDRNRRNRVSRKDSRHRWPHPPTTRSGARIPSRTPALGNPFPRGFGRSESPEQSVEKGFSTQVARDPRMKRARRPKPPGPEFTPYTTPAKRSARATRSGARIPSRTSAPGNPFPRDLGRSESPEQSVEKGFSTQVAPPAHQPLWCENPFSHPRPGESVPPRPRAIGIAGAQCRERILDTGGGSRALAWDQSVEKGFPTQVTQISIGTRSAHEKGPTAETAGPGVHTLHHAAKRSARATRSGARIPSRTSALGNPFPRDLGRSESPEQSVEKGFSTQGAGAEHRCGTRVSRRDSPHR